MQGLIILLISFTTHSFDELVILCKKRYSLTLRYFIFLDYNKNKIYFFIYINFYL